MGGYRAPSVGVAVAGTAFYHGIRSVKTIVKANKRLTIGVETVDGNIDTVVGVVVASLTVFGLVVDDRTFNLYLAGREIALEVLHVGGGVP